MTRLLLMEGNSLARQDEARALGVRTASDVYQQAIHAHFPDLNLDVLHAADRGQSLPGGRVLDDYAGMVISGSGLHAYDQSFEVLNQIKWLKSFAETGKPILGSCWGLQIAAIAAGGKVGLSDNGREIGIARKVQLTEAGKTHPFLANKPDVYDAPCIHYDEITELPEGSILLCSNRHSQVQGAIIPVGISEVWGVQYHPEFDVAQLSQLMTLYEQNMYDQGFVNSNEEFKRYKDLLNGLAKKPDDKALAWQLGIDSDITDDHVRRAEIINWVEFVLNSGGHNG